MGFASVFVALHIAQPVEAPATVAGQIDTTLPVKTAASHDWHVQPATDRCNFVEMVSVR